MIGNVSSNHDTPVESALESATLVDLLRSRAQNQPERVAYIFLRDGEAEDRSLTYAQLDRQARAIGALLQSLSAEGARALLLYPAGTEFIAAFFGCLYAGVIAVPAYPPDPARLGRTLPRLQSIAKDAQPSVVLTTSDFLLLAEKLGTESPLFRALRMLATDGLADCPEGDWREPEIAGNTVAFLQYTSGSTSAPKGVMVSHANLLHNQEMIRVAKRHTEQSTFVSWLPLYHDMGLIGTVLQPLYIGAPSVIMPPQAFLQNPFRWLQAITKYRAATSGAPNFAYDLCVKKLTAEQRATLDLSSWTTAFNGAEPVRHSTLEQFAATFEPCGFRREAFSPCYGLAEATLYVSGSRIGTAPSFYTVNTEELKRNNVVPAADGREAARTLVSCGHTVQGHEVVIVDPDHLTQCPPGKVGEVWFSGPSVTLGYWNRPEDTDRTFNAYMADTGEGPFLRTGDLGFLTDEGLFITGRMKDLIIIRGRNHYPQDIELTVEKSHPALRPGCGAAFSIEVAGEERLALVHEVDERKSPGIEGLMDAIRYEIAENHELQVHAISLIKPGTIPKTSSGKIQRHACRAALLSGGLDSIAERREVVRAAGEAQAQSLVIKSARDIEGWLASTLADKLGLDSRAINVDEPITHYGLDSMIAIEMIHAIETVTGAVLPITGILQNQSVAEVASEAFAQLNEGKPGKISHRAVADKSVAEYPLSRGQQALWFLHQLAPQSAAYNVSAAARIHGGLDAQALRRAFQKLVDRHTVLRTTFRSLKGEPFQLIKDRADVCFDVIDASGWTQVLLDRRLAEEAHQPFSLEEGPLFRVRLFEGPSEEHTLLIVVHHILIDFWSLGVLVNELGGLYDGERSAAAASLRPVAAQYTDFVEWQSEMLAGPEGERLWRYWQGQLAGEITALNLPTDRSRPSIQNYAGESQPFRIGEGLTDRLKALGQGHEATLYTTLLAAFQVLLHRYSGQPDILAGSPAAARSHAEFDRVVGYFVNPLVLRADFSGDPHFDEFLKQARQTVLAALEHQDYPFALLVERLQPQHDPSRSPLFQVMFVFHKAPTLNEQGLSSFALGEQGARINVGQLPLESVALRHRVSQFDLTLAMSEAQGGLAGSLQFNTDLFDAPTIARMIGHFQTLLEAIVANPRQRISEPSLLTEPERRSLAAWNETRADYPTDLLIHQLFEAQAEKQPGNVAVIFASERITYGELNRRANQLAHHLRGLGVGPETRVGICLERSVEMVVGLLAILKAGAAYVPLDPAYPASRLAFMLEDSAARVLLTRRRFLGALEDYKGEVVLLDADYREAAGRSEANLASTAEARNLAYVIYTSGSTGRPKGVAIEHRSAVALLHWARDTFSARELGGVLASTSICFDLSVFELFAPLCLGGKVILVENALSLPNDSAKDEVRLINTVPSAMAELVRQGAIGEGVITVNLAGEALHRRLADEVYGSGRVERVCNLYGPSEDTTYSTFEEVGRAGSEAVTIGRPVSNTRVYVLSERMSEMPIGVSGEIYIGGEGLARGYLNRADKTAERFVPDPFGERGGERLYRTGDVGRYRADGRVEYLGREDGQVKVRGFRIELGEIEALLKQYPAVRECAVIVREDVPGDKRIIAYLLAESERAISTDELYGYVSRKLPGYMVPSAFVMLDEMPATPNGKVNRRALPRPENVKADSEVRFDEPRNAVEEMLVEIFAEVLRQDRVGIHENFFRLGGHSLLATQVVSRLRERVMVDLPLRSFFESPTVAGLSRSILAASATGQSSPYLPIPKAASGQNVPLSFAQQRLWFLHLLMPENPFYNIPTAVRLRGPLKVSALEQSINEVVRRQDVLRTSFHTFDDLPAQVIHPSITFHLQVIDLSDTDQHSRQAEGFSLATRLARQPFDLSVAPAFRAALIRLGEEDHLLLIVMHHIISDQWSLGVMMGEVARAYDSLSSGRDVEMAELPIQYGDYAAWQQGWLESEAYGKQLSYWKGQLTGRVSVLSMPTDRARPAMPSYEGGMKTFKLSGKLTRGVKELSEGEGATVYMTLLAAFYVMLSRYSGQEEIVVGTPIAGRSRAEVAGLIGCFINTLVLRVEVRGAESFRDVMREVKGVTMEAYANQEVPFEKVVEEVEAKRELSRNPLFDVMMVYQNVPMPEMELGGVRLEEEEIHNGTAKLDLVLTMSEGKEALKGYFEYSTDLFEAETINRMAGHFERLLESAVAGAGEQVCRLRMMSGAEQAQLMSWGRASREYDVIECLHEMFERQAQNRPKAVAVACGQDEVTYDELERWANRLARRLRRAGVGPEVLVAVLMERSVEMIVGLLAVVKAGGAYVPMDPGYPRQRLDYILEDTAAGVVLTQSEMAWRVEGCEAQVICVDQQRAEESSEQEQRVASGAVAESGAVADNAAYVIYTSGSTGRPKGVVITHRNVVRLIDATKEQFRFNEYDVWTMFHSYAFDFSVWEMWGALVSGGKLVVVPYEVSRSPEAFLDLVEREKVTVLNQTPSAFRQLMKAERERSEDGVKSLRVVIFGGEALELGSLRAWTERHGDERTELVNMYGITETTVHVTYRRIMRRDVEEARGSLIGNGISDLDVYVLDDEMELAPIGVAGELYVGGSGLARGYLNRADQTAQRFVPDHVSGRAGGRLYKTGDSARHLADGGIEYLGRIDQQVKIRGFRIELGEIEATLARHAIVREAVVVAREDAPGEKRLVAYVVSQEKQPDAVTTLRGYLKDNLPSYMLPSAIVLLDELPLTTNGKINRAALPPPGDLRPELESAYVAPVSEAEQTIASVWRELLQVDRVGMHDNLFDLGAHSLMMIQANKKLGERFGREIPMVDMFKFPTVSSMAKHLTQARQDSLVTQPDQGAVESRIESMKQRKQFRKQHRASKK